NSFWSSLPEDIRSELNIALDEAIQHGNTIAANKAANDKQLIVDSRRSTIVSLSNAERQQWINVMQPVWKKFEKQIGKDLIDAAVASN
ncbi:MAG: C4-dicarboxylate ABC transporter, partial [Colwellia sp.]